MFKGSYFPKLPFLLECCFLYFFFLSEGDISGWGHKEREFGFPESQDHCPIRADSFAINPLAIVE